MRGKLLLDNRILRLRWHSGGKFFLRRASVASAQRRNGLPTSRTVRFCPPGRRSIQPPPTDIRKPHAAWVWVSGWDLLRRTRCPFSLCAPWIIPTFLSGFILRRHICLSLSFSRLNSFLPFFGGAVCSGAICGVQCHAISAGTFWRRRTQDSPPLSGMGT
jgi:hypothetical protein